LHEQLIAPARARGSKQIWIAGASMGGMGALMYEREHPGEVAGLVLMAPYVGEAALIREIADAGGPAHWDPGPLPAELNRDTVPREEWRVIRSWTDRPDLAQRVWLICGDEDRFAAGARMIAPLLPQGHFLELHGRHAWTVWNAGATEVFRQLRLLSAARTD
jgi:pimeloyl-ACP methyl ester carboxylesterase